MGTEFSIPVSSRPSTNLMDIHDRYTWSCSIASLTESEHSCCINRVGKAGNEVTMVLKG
ncbi:hypothetical protein F4813DRAFT_353754 [Daldinia decipiens]|uniref:uncharacterized protein n=1 Tax=Daldinia decipiens TaxID=326647 RepID=UPI0020C246E2|nr:uncharacterized protein F4813DRAFT_353754 [Daldinia decipiens]KAI1659066.1 hypothetical protein F4813DRAFT_353754 [Daldinia decipiens]